MRGFHNSWIKYDPEEFIKMLQANKDMNDKLEIGFARFSGPYK